MDIDVATRVFLDFVARFQPDVPDLTQHGAHEPTPIDVKREHSLYVLDNARNILQKLDVSPELQRLGLLAALFHDVGRFPQYQQYKTFHDPSSLNHGLLGCRTLAPAPRGLGLLDALPFAERSLVRGAVAMHNRNTLPRGISPRLRFITQVVRDADKLDIMRVMIEHFSNNGQDPVITLHVTSHPQHYSQTIYDDVIHGNRGDYRKMRWSNDFKLLLVGWANDLNFSSSRNLLQKRQLLPKLFRLLPDTEAMHTLRQRIFEMLEEASLKPDPLPPKLCT